ncbi:hypothetical protein ABPG72_000097 [Tetrahymena utriculariae]
MIKTIQLCCKFAQSLIFQEEIFCFIFVWQSLQKKMEEILLIKQFFIKQLLWIQKMQEFFLCSSTEIHFEEIQNFGEVYTMIKVLINYNLLNKIPVMDQFESLKKLKYKYSTRYLLKDELKGQNLNQVIVIKPSLLFGETIPNLKNQTINLEFKYY